MRFIAIILALLCAASATTAAQGLASVAKQEEERRKSVRTSGKVYTNDKLKADTTSGSTPAPPAATTDSAAVAPPSKVPSVNLPAGPPAGDAKDEAYWRKRITGVRAALERSRIFADALQSRLNALATDIVNRADPAQRAQLELERQRAESELHRVNKEMAEQTKAIAQTEEEGRKAGVPPGWLR